MLTAGGLLTLRMEMIEEEEEDVVSEVIHKLSL